MMEPMKPMKPMAPMKPMKGAAKWWPTDLGEPATSGGQNDVQYAFFPEKHRLAIQRDGQVTVYDSGEHQISGVSQRQGGGSALTFSGQKGDLDIGELKKVD